MINLDFQEQGGQIICFTSMIKKLEPIQSPCLKLQAFFSLLLCEKCTQSQQPKSAPIMSLAVKNLAAETSVEYLPKGRWVP